MRVFLRLFHPLPHHLDAHDVLNVDLEHVGARHCHVQRRRAAAAAAPPPLDFSTFFSAASTASRRAQAPLNRPTTPYQSRPDNPQRCPPSFPRLARPERSAPSRACSRRDATRACRPPRPHARLRRPRRRASASAACRDVDVDDWRVENAVLGAAGSAIPRRRYGL